ncbi:AAA family ATPase [Endozoicomonas sp. 8E]|uniref:AAA family ATPase n=1 Tax=Endozoicomonas sp. 8E TaxID=3035692 RepID=UPI0029391318|nr:AAA family ATPase [Endozoicomonas sp. 8E]WOG28844.1 AAA family ATPase [Endozoicomonas sp. 8E]
MDGQINGKTNNPVFKTEKPDGGIPPKRARLDLKPEIAEVTCVTARLNISSTSRGLPDKTRTVSATDSSLQKATHSFDFRFVTSDDEVRQLLIARTCDKHQDVTVISHPDDLSQANLVSRLSITGNGRHTLNSGKLFESSQPLTLVIDIRKLTSEELPKFNDLLDPNKPCLYDKVSQKKRLLGEHVSLLVLADPAQLASVGQRQDAAAAGAPGAAAPGADFWRRINRPGNTWQFNEKTGNASSMDINEVRLLAELPSAESAMDDEDTLLINCHLHSSWRQLLLGGPGVDQQGRIRHIPGKLESLKAGQRVILKGADWQDLAFEQTLRQMLAQQCFESNGKICPLPDDVQFYQMPLGNNELHTLFQSLSRSDNKEDDKELDKGQAAGNPIIINQSNIREWLSPIAIAPEGYAVPNTCLLEQIRAGGVVTLTSPLTEALWFRLLGSLQTIRETTGLTPRLQVAHPGQQPEALGLTESDEHPIKDHATFNAVTYQQHAQTSHWINNQQEAPLVIQVTEQTGFSQLFDNIHITSEQQAHFGRRPSKLQEALTAGRPVVFRGLERNPRLQQLLEPLVIGQPLLVNGQLQAYPKAHVTLLWPEFGKSPSSVFYSLVAKGKPCPEVDLWAINANRHEIPRTELPEQALNKLYQAFKTVPAGRFNPLPEMNEGLLNNLIMTARRAQQVDQSSTLLPRHWRRAINSVITHGTRQNPLVRDFMKVACWQLLPDKMPDKDHPLSVDPDQLMAIINSAPRLDRAFLEQNLWRLARAIDLTVFKNGKSKGLLLSYEEPVSFWGKAKFLDRLCALIVALGPEERRQAMAYQLKVDSEAAKRYPPLTIRPSRQIKRLQDALASGWQLRLSPGQTRSDAIQALASDCFHRARTANSKTEGIERIAHRLSESLKWTGSTDKPLQALVWDLYHGEISQKDRESRRLSRLHDRLTDSPVIFLQGETGTGKSYFSAKMARALGQASVISLGPCDSEQTLMKRWQWQQHADGDRSMMQQNRALMEWANSKSDKDGEYITLVLDEANLTQAGLLASLNGLWEPQPCIYVNGHPVKVSAKHRVILTGNPDHYSGRQMDPALKEELPKAYYRRLDQAFLRDRVVEPALVKHLQEHLTEQQINDIAYSATNSVMALWQYYQELLPEHEFTPRDLTDICSWVGWYLDRAQPARVTCGQINSLIQHSFRDVLGPEITETHQDALSALEIWFAARYQAENTLSDRVLDKTLSDIQQAFSTVSEKIRPDFDTSGSAVRELAQPLWQDLSRCQQANHRKIKHDGRQATLIEGPAGRGKDATLNLVIESVKQQAEQRQASMPEVYYLNACDCSWDAVCEAIQKAKVEGGIVVISEMNLIDSQHLEGELNDILAGDAHPGFHLFATINPPEYSGRKPLSPALKGRFRHLPIRQYNPEELQTIAEKVLPESSQGTFIAKKLTEKHCLLRAHLQGKKLPLQPTSLDLQNAARAITRGGDFTEKAIHQCLNQHYRLYLMAAGLSLEELPESSAITTRNGELDSGLCHWFNETVSDIDRPWLIRSSHLNSVDEKKHEILVNTQRDEKEVRTEIIKSVAQAKWQSSGLPLKPDESDDILTGALYRHWQQRWFSNHFGRTNVDANSVFPLTEEQQQTLKMSANQPYLHAADQQIRDWKADEVQWWPAFWHQISDLPNHLADDFINEASAIGGDKAPEQDKPEVHEKQAQTLDQRTEPAPQTVNDVLTISSDKVPPQVHEMQTAALDQRTNHEPQPVNKALAVCGAGIPEKYIPEVHEKEAPVLDRRTDYENEKESERQLDDYIIFDDPDHFPGIYRSLAEDIYVSPEGKIKSISINDKHMQGVEVIIPARLPEHDREVTLASDQTLATFYMSSKNGQFILPSLTVKDYIVALRIEPNLAFTLLRDRYTGIHTLFIPEAKADQNIKFAYVVEPREAGKKTAAEEIRPAQSRRFDAQCCEGMKTVLDDVFEKIEKQASKVRKPLLKIVKAEDTEQRIRAIRDYCEDFSGVAVAKRNKNFFHFLVTRRQGSCRHRVPVFIALCRYFGIPCRQISNDTHAFAECSPDGGQTWKSVDLGGAPVEVTEILPEFQDTRRVSVSGTELKKTRDLLNGHLKDADLAQQQTLAEACGTSPEELNEALEAGCESPETLPDIFEIVKNLWETNYLTGFSMGVSILVSLETKALGFDETELVCTVFDKSHPMSETVKHILSSSDRNQVTEPLKLLHSKMIIHGSSEPEDWLILMQNILSDIDLTPAVIDFAREALASGWLDIPPTYAGQIVEAHQHHELLVRLQGVDELRVKASHLLKKWYKKLFFREKDSQSWQRAYHSFQTSKFGAFFVTRCHHGLSPFLEKNILTSSVRNAWTDQPEGIANIERMLVHHPAFPKLISGKAHHRPVIITGKPDFWISDLKVKYKKVEALLQQIAENRSDLKHLLEKNSQFMARKKELELALSALDNDYTARSPDHKKEYRKKRSDISRRYQSILEPLRLSSEEEALINNLQDKCMRALKQAFSHYLYEVTHLKGGCLTYCWANAHIDGCWDDHRYGAHDPSSPEELHAMMSAIRNEELEKSIQDDCLRQALNASDALVLKTNELNTIAEEFLNSVNLNSLCEALAT